MVVPVRPTRSTVPRPLHLAILLLAGMVGADGAAETVWTGDYVPPPEPVESSIELGVYIFPGWYRDEGRGDYPYRTHDEDSEWRLVAKKPAPRPLLGFYDDSLPEVNDWHIKWALEHGISFFCFDWYWNAGEHRLLRTLEDGFLKARYNHLMKFCIHWCNHGMDWRDRAWNRPTDEDFQTPALVEMVEYLADNYFKLDNYLTIDGRPVLVVWDWRRLLQANGGPAGFGQAVEEMNRALRARGVADICLVAVGGGKELEEAQFSAVTGYGYYGTDYDSKYEWRGGYSIPYEEMVKHYETMWGGMSDNAGLPYIPPIGSKWDNRPRAGANAAVIAGKTPEKFAGMCEASLEHIDERANMAIIEAWNEWGEGSFIEPDREWGFAFLDAVRETFTDAPDEYVDYAATPDRIASFGILNDEEVAQARVVED
ncbi:MAG TPA: glycoside hydrolase family 99-like domain-containing protein, partial [Armatimonadota bacterium]|nr:glycoside hydrolase family 99-like domain-containing protein [Armatimonadota bacterium]